MSSAAALRRQDVPFTLFGGVGVAGGIDLGGPKQRAVLAVLLLEPGRVVSLDRIVDAVWGDDPPNRPEVSVRGYVSNLRAALGDMSALAWRDGGYVAEVDAGDVDIHRFERFVERAAALARDGRLLDAAGEVEAATALWRGRPFGGLADDAPFASTVARLEERAAQLEELATDVRLARGEAAELVAELTDAVAAQPFRERRRALLALALYRAGRPVDALEGDVRQQVLSDAPLAMRLLWRATRRRHAKLVAATFVGVPEPAPVAG